MKYSLETQLDLSYEVPKGSEMRFKNMSWI